MEQHWYNLGGSLLPVRSKLWKPEDWIEDVGKPLEYVSMSGKI
jgi:hypothetical protein